ncbi:MAG: hypothetical protein A2020_13825 [Lentisphaerae bacterium GWF2_45_14]|nr:MAG: hypothetical protein A2020_13825 [Lentisphaerae bacterium GWF2_45_14]
MADIIFACPFCNTPLMVEEELKGGLALCYKCESTVMVPMPGVYPGMKLAGYTIEEQIGSGGMGEVWKASHAAMGRTVAVKILSPAMTTNPESVAKFMKEVETTAKLDHPNIVTGFDAGVENGIYYLVTAFVDGETLKARLEREKTLPEKEALNIALKISEALAYAWDAYKLIHSDINPGNIMMTHSGIVKLTDLGISKSMAEDASLTHSGMIIGTPHYMSPEQAKVEPDIDCRADIYSLGSTLYHLVTGHVPFEASSAITVLARHLTDQLTPARKRNHQISKECSRLISAMMAKDKKLRPLNWKVLIGDIKKVLAGEMPSVSEPEKDTTQSRHLTQSEKEIMISRRVSKTVPKTKLSSPGKGYAKRNGRKLPVNPGNSALSRQEKPDKAKPFYLVGAITFLLILIIAGTSLFVQNKNKKALALAREKEELLQTQLRNAEKLAKINRNAPIPKKNVDEVPEKKDPQPENTLVFAGIRISSTAPPEEIWEKVRTVGNKAIASRSDIETAIKLIEEVKPRFAGTEFEEKAGKAIATLQKAKEASEKKRKEASNSIIDWKKRASETGASEEENHIQKICTEAQKASGTEIKISPSGGDGTESAHEAVKKLQSGTVLSFEPGRYLTNSISSCEAENVVIQGSRDVLLEELRVSDSPKIIIRNITCNSLIVFSDCVIIDSVIGKLDISGGEITVSNCLITNIMVPGGTPNVKVRNCTFAPQLGATKGQVPAVYCGAGSNISIYDSIIYSPDTEPLVFSSSFNGSFKLENSIVNAPENPAAVKEFDFGNFNLVRGITSLSESGLENVSIKNVLEEPPGFVSLLKKDYRLNPASPGKAAMKEGADAGARLDAEGFPCQQ